VPFPAAGIVPTVVPPLVHIDGSELRGPNTLKVIVPVALLEPELSANTPLIADAAIAVPAVPVAGAVTVKVGDAFAPRLAPVKTLAAATSPATAASSPTPKVDELRMKPPPSRSGSCASHALAPFFPTAR
jgi:hypothetical protein